MTDTPRLPDDIAPDLAAAELALGLLDGTDRADALARTLADPGFAQEVDRWRRWLGPLAEAMPDAAPPPGLLARIDASIDTAPRVAPAPIGMPRRSGWWPAATALASMAAAILLVLLIARPAPPAPPPTPMALPSPAALLAAAIQPTGAGAAIVALYDSGDATIRLGASPVTDARHAAELWAIAGKAPPRALGLLRGTSSRLTITAAERATLGDGVTLAISREPAGGSPTGAPTGPVIATGVLRPV